MFSCDFGHLLAAGHSRKLVDPLVVADLGDPRSRAPLARFLANDKMPIREGGDLRKMGDAEHLVLGRKFRQNAPHPLSGRTADSGVDLVEDDDHIPVRTAQRILDRQKEPREFAARSDLLDRPWHFARICREEKLRSFATARAGLQPFQQMHPIDRFEPDNKLRPSHREIAELGFN